MEKDQIVILKDRGLIFVSGSDADSFLQNIITNDIKKVSKTNTIFSGIFTPQGKYLFEFFITKSGNSFFWHEVFGVGYDVDVKFDFSRNIGIGENVELKLYQ